jgi:hypothetical protein
MNFPNMSDPITTNRVAGTMTTIAMSLVAALWYMVLSEIQGINSSVGELRGQLVGIQVSSAESKTVMSNYLDKFSILEKSLSVANGRTEVVRTEMLKDLEDLKHQTQDRVDLLSKQIDNLSKRK